MSVITDMVLVTFMEDREAVDRLNAWCQAFDGDRGQRFAKLDEDMAGGSKWFTGQIWAMSGNYFRWYELVEALPTFGWRSPDNVLLLVDDEHGDEPLAFRGDGRRAVWEPAEQPEAARNPRYGALGRPEPYFGSDDQREPGCPACGTILNAKAAGCDGAWHADNRPASGGVVEPSGPLTAEEATPDCGVPNNPGGIFRPGCCKLPSGHPGWHEDGGLSWLRDREELERVVERNEHAPARRRHDPGALIEEPDLYEQGGHLDGEFAAERGKFDPLIGEQGEGDDRG